ncbi:MAG: hypothetical protein VX205_10280 [Pseudomonadota bacterium]|nr:hypothetical protein [Pseudomonadota bacterium]
MIDRLKSVAKKVGAGAIWLWHLPIIRSKVLTVLARVGLGSSAVAIFTAIVDGLAQ